MEYYKKEEDGISGNNLQIFQAAASMSVMVGPSAVHVTNRVTPGSGGRQPSQACRMVVTHQSTTPSMVHVTNRVTPGSQCNPTPCRRTAWGFERHTERILRWWGRLTHVESS
jgi:hypothetical protein